MSAPQAGSTTLAVGALTARLGVLEHGGQRHLVHHLAWFGRRVGHARELPDKRWRWVVYGKELPDHGGDCIGEGSDLTGALRVARAFLRQAWPDPEGATYTAVRQVGPFSRRPGAGPIIGVARVQRHPLTVEQRNQRGCDVWAVQCASGEERRRLAEACRWKWGWAPPDVQDDVPALAAGGTR